MVSCGEQTCNKEIHFKFKFMMESGLLSGESRKFCLKCDYRFEYRMVDSQVLYHI